MKIGILECGHAMPEVEARHGNYPEMFAHLLRHGDFRFESYDVEFMQFPDDIHDCDGWLLTGSKHGVYEDHAFIPPLEKFIRDAYAERVPLVGICFGHQIIAQALGGQVEKFSGGWGLGLTEYQFDGIGPVSLNAWHQDQVIELPKGARPVATNSFCQYAALAYGTRAFTVQAHPEFSGPVIADLARLRRGTGTYPDDRMDAATSRTGQPDNNDVLAREIAAFFTQSREVAHAS